MISQYELSGNNHWWPRDAKSRKRATRILKQMNRVLTPTLVNNALPPLAPKLWRKLYRKHPELYQGDRKAVQVLAVQRLGKEELEAFRRACRKWKVTTGDALIAFMALFVKLVESEDKE